MCASPLAHNWYNSGHVLVVYVTVPQERFPLNVFAERALVRYQMATMV